MSKNKEGNMKKFNIIYQTTNLINGKYYVGKHETNNLNDGYVGSGNSLIAAIKKYSKENFETKILASFETKEEMEAIEELVVDEFMVEDNNCYNIAIGGQGGNTNNYKQGTETKKLRGSGKLSEEGRKILSQNMSDLNRKMNSDRDYSNRDYSYCRGKNHYNYKEKGNCMDCEIQLKSHNTKRCRSCNMKKRWNDKKALENAGGCED